MPATVWKGFLSFGLVSFPVRPLQFSSYAVAKVTMHNREHRAGKKKNYSKKDLELAKPKPAAKAKKRTRKAA